MAQERFLKSSVLDEGTLGCLQELNAIATERGETLAQMSLGWILHHPGVTTVLVGAGSPEQLTRNLRGSDVASFTPEETARIEAAVSRSTVYP
jgi:L-glyceraldehyde 3-phosphate reductase